MTTRGFYTLLTGTALVVVGLSTGNAACLLLGGTASSALVLMLLSVLLPRFTLRVTQQIPGQETMRLSRCQLHAQIFLLSLLPIAPLGLDVQLPSGRRSAFLIHARPFGWTESRNDFPCPHVGTYPVGIACVTVQDCLGLFCFSKRLNTLQTLHVLPQAAAVSPVPVHPGSEDGPASAYASTDYTTPDGIRDWIQGDELKRVHWKLSVSRRTLLVRTYEQQERPDTLILINLGGIDPSSSQAASRMDALTESCAGTVSNLLDENRPVCIPLPELRTELRGESSRAFQDIQRMLSQLTFREEDHFPEALEVAAPRLQRTDTLLIFSPVITPMITESIIRLSQFGSNIRFTLAAGKEVSSQEMKLLQMLVAANIETFQVSIS
ncbi:MAG: DUF58 domain-containing protein [Clostridia bacterium]|nr:DUF58 domain-containing protein [Clostridia bacterium]